jgi:sigma-B regulation protein RsbU (phosphoserine phosphatase)
MILGFDPDVSYETMAGAVEPGDLLVAYSDGVTESQNEDEEEFGETRLIRAVQESRDEPIDVIKTNIDSAVDDFVDGAAQFDDYTLVLLKRA